MRLTDEHLLPCLDRASRLGGWVLEIVSRGAAIGRNESSFTLSLRWTDDAHALLQASKPPFDFAADFFCEGENEAPVWKICRVVTLVRTMSSGDPVRYELWKSFDPRTGSRRHAAGQ